MLGVVYLFFAVIALIGCLYHLLFFSVIQNTVFEVIKDPDYLALRSEFWGTLLLGLCVCLALEGIYKIRQSSVDEER